MSGRKRSRSPQLLEDDDYDFDENCSTSKRAACLPMNLANWFSLFYAIFSFEKSANSTKCGQCTWTGSYACTVECILPIENEIALGAGGHKTIQIGYPAIGHHLHSTIAIVFGQRRFNATRWILKCRCSTNDQCKSTESGEIYCVFPNFDVILSDGISSKWQVSDHSVAQHREKEEKHISCAVHSIEISFSLQLWFNFHSGKRTAGAIWFRHTITCLF